MRASILVASHWLAIWLKFINPSSVAAWFVTHRFRSAPELLLLQPAFHSQPISIWHSWLSSQDDDRIESESSTNNAALRPGNRAMEAMAHFYQGTTRVLDAFSHGTYTRLVSRNMVKIPEIFSWRFQPQIPPVMLQQLQFHPKPYRSEPYVYNNFLFPAKNSRELRQLSHHKSNKSTLPTTKVAKRSPSFVINATSTPSCFVLWINDWTESCNLQSIPISHQFRDFPKKMKKKPIRFLNCAKWLKCIYLGYAKCSILYGVQFLCEMYPSLDICLDAVCTMNIYELCCKSHQQDILDCYRTSIQTCFQATEPCHLPPANFPFGHIRVSFQMQTKKQKKNCGCLTSAVGITFKSPLNHH